MVTHVSVSGLDMPTVTALNFGDALANAAANPNETVVVTVHTRTVLDVPSSLDAACGVLGGREASAVGRAWKKKQ